jgi:hypothetical protein
MSKIIIGIHGLGNKPPQKLLKKWWLQAIKEGLKAIRHPDIHFHFELVYWANILHPEPLNPSEKNEKSPFYIENPYVPATSIKRKPPSELRKKVLDFIEDKMDKIFLNEDMSTKFSSITDMVIRRYFKDLDLYYSFTYKDGDNNSLLAKEVIRERLAGVLKRHAHHQVLLIAHSMGSIIAFEVLNQLSNDIHIDTLVTAGSPLGQPMIMGKVFAELKPESVDYAMLKTPENVSQNWYNLSDLEDKVTINYNLADDYTVNNKGIGPVDKIVYNNYIYDNKRNPHKSYGYLRTPEMADIIYDFLIRDRNKLALWFSNRIHMIITKIFRKS